jgi:hypothetical protein
VTRYYCKVSSLSSHDSLSTLSLSSFISHPPTFSNPVPKVSPLSPLSFVYRFPRSLLSQELYYFFQLKTITPYPVLSLCPESYTATESLEEINSLTIDSKFFVMILKTE